MNRIKETTSQISFRQLSIIVVAIVTICLLSGACALAQSTPWWDTVPRLVCTSDVQTAIDYHASLAMTGAGTDPGWGRMVYVDQSRQCQWVRR